jgi:hypothetical protein
VALVVLVRRAQALQLLVVAVVRVAIQRLAVLAARAMSQPAHRQVAVVAVGVAMDQH